jgi:hypothetical protein
MKERSKEKIADLLMDELLTQLGERGNLRKMLGEMTGLPIGPLIEDLVSEFEQIVDRHRVRSLARGEVHADGPGAQQGEYYTPDTTPSVPLPVLSSRDDIPFPVVEPVSKGEDHLHVERDEGPKVDETVLSPQREDTQESRQSFQRELLPQESESTELTSNLADEDVDTQPAEKKDVADFRQRLEELAKKVESEYLQKLEKGRRKSPVRVEEKAEEHEPQEEAPVPPADARRSEVVEVGPGEIGRPSRVPYRLDDKDYIYLNAVLRIPDGEAASESPFMLEEKGIDGKEFAFALDHDGLRFFLSKVSQNDMNVSRKGLLLLGKAESLQLRGQHESILNELRAHGVILPIEIATVARGKQDLLVMVKNHYEKLESDLERQAATKWWKVGLYVLDGRIAQLFSEEGERREDRTGRERGRVSFAPSLLTKKFDVKLLEKVLQKEKKLAESVHEELARAAERSEIQSMVGLGSGSSDEWKLILQSTYLVTSSFALQRFTRTVTDLQYRHILFEPMISMTGDREPFSFIRK